MKRFSVGHIKHVKFCDTCQRNNDIIVAKIVIFIGSKEIYNPIDKVYFHLFIQQIVSSTCYIQFVKYWDIYRDNIL